MVLFVGGIISLQATRVSVWNDEQNSDARSIGRHGSSEGQIVTRRVLVEMLLNVKSWLASNEAKR